VFSARPRKSIDAVAEAATAAAENARAAKEKVAFGRKQPLMRRTGSVAGINTKKNNLIPQDFNKKVLE